MRGQVLTPDVDVRVVVDPVAEVGTKRPVPAPDRVVQGIGRVAVVDQEDDAAREAGGRVGDPGVEGQADLGSLAVAEDDPVGGETFGQGRRRRVGLDVDEASVLPADGDLTQDAADA